jgi:shikimate dehydrogenase
LNARTQAPLVGAEKRLLGLIGSGISRSLTPAMHEVEASAQGLRLHYQLIDLERSTRGPQQLAELVDAARVMGFAGLNITFPCKQAVIGLLDELSEDAKRMGAVNTVVFKDGRAIGHNTDASGWCFGFERDLPSASLARVVLLGAGGAGSAIAHALLEMGAEVLVIVDAEAARAEELAQSLNRMYPSQRASAELRIEAAMQGASGLVHATPTGMAKLPGLPLPERLLTPEIWVSEIVYFPIETELLRAASRIGCRTSSGGGMAVGQAVHAFELFTGLKAEAARMEQHFSELLVAQAALRSAEEHRVS